MTRQVQQNLLTMNANGEATAVFPGGMQLLANVPPNTPPNFLPARAITWVKESDGSVVADIASYDGVGVDSLELAVRTGNQAIVRIESGHVNLSAGAGTRTLSRDNGWSSYVQVAGNSALDGGVYNTLGVALFGGLVSSLGVLAFNAVPDNPGILTTSKLGGLGAYLIDYTAMGFLSTPTIVASTFNGGVARTQATYDANICAIQTFNLAGALADLTFSFIGLGVLAN